VTDEPAQVKPRLRGVLHTYAFYVSLVTGVALVFVAGGLLARVAAVAYAISVSALFGASALYHRVNWSPRARRWMRRLDHSMIYLLIAGTYTPFGLLVLDGTLGRAVLWVVWAGALAGIAVKLIWIDAPKWISAVVYLALAWVGVVTVPSMWETIGAIATVLVLIGGLLYTAGALVYALRRPDPLPKVFGYHELFHALVIAAAGVQYSVVAGYALPA
jgi:hemolysin III